MKCSLCRGRIWPWQRRRAKVFYGLLGVVREEFSHLLCKLEWVLDVLEAPDEEKEGARSEPR